MNTTVGTNRFDSIEAVPKPLSLLALGIQHVLVMYSGAVAVPLIIGSALGLPKEQIAFLINADLLACGIATIIQSVGVGGVGIRMPVIMGVAFTAVGPIIGIGLNPELGLPGIFGAVIVSGIFTLILSPYISRLVHLFP